MDFNRVVASLVSLIPSALYSASLPSSKVFFTVKRSFVMRPPNTMPSFAFLSSSTRAAMRSRAVTMGSVTVDPSRRSTVRVCWSRTISHRIWTISWTFHLFSRNAVSSSPGQKNEVSPSEPATISWLSDLARWVASASTRSFAFP